MHFFAANRPAPATINAVGPRQAALLPEDCSIQAESPNREETRRPDPVIAMKRISRVFLALAIFSGGTGIALLYRLESTAPTPVSSESDPQTVLRQWAGATDTAPGGSSDGITRPLAMGTGHESMPDAAQRTEPRSAEGYSSQVVSSTAAGRGNDLRTTLRPPAATRSERTHKIVDGDTLQEIARKYLGSASLAGEIFQANRAKLADPALLPIGVELTIPSAVQRAAPTPGSPRRHPLVPVASSRRSTAN